MDAVKGEQMNDPSHEIAARVVAGVTAVFGALAAAWKFYRMVGPRLRQWAERRRAQQAGLEHLPELIREVNALRERLEAGNDPMQMLESLRNVEIALQGVRQTTWTILDISGLAFWEADTAGEVIYASTHLAELVGLAPQAILGNGWVATLHPDDRDRVYREWQAAVAQRRFFALRYRFQHLDGRVVAVWGKGLPLYGATGQVGGFVAVLKEDS
ncbi:MAG: PAS domain S-box protein [Desulfurellales bacterium]|nr:MAG: PAS domain S-box protein [Desulfurellales bacterium]